MKEVVQTKCLVLILAGEFYFFPQDEKRIEVRRRIIRFGLYLLLGSGKPEPDYFDFALPYSCTTPSHIFSTSPISFSNAFFSVAILRLSTSSSFFQAFDFLCSSAVASARPYKYSVCTSNKATDAV